MNKKSLCAACDERTSLGLSLAGVTEILEWSEGDDPRALFDWFREMEGSGKQIMILSPEAGEAMGDRLLQRRMEGRTHPLIVILPREGRDTIAQNLIKRAIGMDIEGKEV